MSVLTLDIQTLTADFFAVLKTDSAGTSVRAALGDGANSVVPATDLAKTPLPAAPFLVLRGGPASGDRRLMRDAFFTWYLYDDAQQRWRRINGLLPLIEAAYTNDPRVIPWHVIHIGSFSSEVTDAALARPTRSMAFQVRTRR